MRHGVGWGPAVGAVVLALAALSASLVLVSSSGASAQSPPPPSLLGSWQGNGSTTDSSGNGNNGTLAGAAGYDSRGIVPIAFSFDGTNGTSVDIPHSAALGAPQTSGAGWSISAWVKPTAAPTGPADQRWIFGQDQGPQLVLYAPDSSSFVARVQYKDQSKNFVSAQSAATIPIGDWTFLTGTWDGTALSVYVNGALSGSPSVTTDPPVASDNGCGYFIGGVSENSSPSCSYTGQFFTGLIDNVSYYSGALSSTAVGALDAQTPGASPGDLVTNGSFELPVVTNADTFDTYPASSTGIPGWTVTGGSNDPAGGSVDLINGLWQPYDGAHSVDLDGGAAGGLSQTLATTAGQGYTLKFAFSGNPDSPGPHSMVVKWGGTAIGTYTWTAANSRSNMQWQTASVPITAESTTGSTTLAFTSTDAAGSFYGVVVDDVSVMPSGSAPSAPSAPTGVSAVGGSAGQASVSFGPPSSDGGSTVSSYTVTASPGGATATGASSPIVLSGLTDGNPYTFTVTATNLTGTSLASAPSGAVIPGADAWTNADTIPLSGTGSESGSTSGSIDLSGQARWYRVPVTPGGTVQVELTNLPANYDLTVYSDLVQAANRLNTTTSDLQALAAETPGNAFSPSAYSPSAYSPSAYSPSAYSPSAYSPSAYSPSAYSPSAYSPSAYSPSAYSPSAYSPSAYSAFSQTYEGAQAQSLLGVSANGGTSNEQVNQAVWNNTGFFYIRVAGQNGAYQPGAPFTVTVNENTGTCGNVSPDTTDPVVSPSYTGIGAPNSGPFGYKTLILTDIGRMGTDSNLPAMQGDLRTVAGYNSVGGTIVDVGAASQRVHTLELQADANPACAYAENLVAGAIRDIVTAVRKQDPGLKYVVLVGSDHVIPFFRYPDTAGLGPESSYAPPVFDTTLSYASLNSNDFLSQDAYGASTTLNLQGVELPVPDLPVGRLMETAGEIDGMLQAYMNTSGDLGPKGNGIVAAPTSSLVTGYDFMTSGANAVEANLCAGLGTCGSPAGPSNPINTTLITPEGSNPGIPPPGSWTASQLKTALTGTRHDLIFLAGHFSADNTEAADFATTMNSLDLLNSNVNLQNSIVFSAGCHSGYNIVNGDAVPGVTQPDDWAEVFAQKQATLIAGTGYQYGDTSFLAYSEKLYAQFSHDLLLGSGPVAVGSALVAAKQDYLGTTTGLQGIDIKSLLESTLYGLPMLSVDMPAGRIAPPTSNSIVVPSDVLTKPGLVLGLSSADLTLTPQLSNPPHTTALQPTNGGPTVTATNLSGPDGVTTSPGAPVLPLAISDVTAAGKVLRGVGFRSGIYSDTPPGITPLTGAPGTDLNGVHTPFISSTFFPSRLWTVNYFGGLTAPASTETQLMLTPAQYESDAPGSLTDIQRQYSSVGVRLFYSGNTTTYPTSQNSSNTPALAAAPTISRVDANVSGDSAGGYTVAFATHVVGDPAAGIQDVWVTYTGVHQPSVGTGEWESLELTQSSTDSTLWSASLVGLTAGQVNALQFVVQAVNGVGEVSMDDNGGAYYQPGQIAPALQTGGGGAAPTTLALTPPAAATFGSSVTVTATLAKTAGGTPLAGEPVSFSLDGASAGSAITGGNGVASVQLTLNTPPGGSHQLAVTFAGTANLAGSSDSTTSFTISPAPTSLTLGGSATVSWGANSQIRATLSSGGSGVATPATVAFVFTPTNGTPGPTVIQTEKTGGGGVAADMIGTQLHAGTYSVQAFFGPGGPITLPTGPDFSASTSSPFALTVIDPSPPVVTITGVSAGGNYPPTPTPVCNTTDALSGVATKATLTITALGGAQTGAFTATCAGATDVAGSLAPPVSVTYTVSTKLGSGTTSCNGAYNGSGGQLVVASGAVCTLLPGTKLSGNVQVGPGGVLNDEGATIGGNLQVTNAKWVSVLGGGTIGGNLQVQGLSGTPAWGDNALCATTVNGDVQVQGNGAAAPIDIGNLGACTGLAALKVGGNLQVVGNAAAVTIGGNAVSGNLQVQSNAAKVTVTGNSAKGNIQVTGNTVGGGTLTGNRAAGSCQLQSNSPKIIGSGNTPSTCNTTA